MDSRVLHQEVRTRGFGSDGASGALAGASGTAKVNPRYGDAGANGAQEVIRAAADQLDYGSRLRGRADIIHLSWLGIELVAGLEAGDRGNRIRTGVDAEAGGGQRSTRGTVVDDVVDVLIRCYLFDTRSRAVPIRRWERAPVVGRRSGLHGALVRRVWHTVTVGIGAATAGGKV